MTDEDARSNLVRFPPLRLRIGVAGHRVPPKLPISAIPKVRAAVDHVLTSVAEAVNQEAATPAVPRERHDGQWSALDETAPCAVISSLAEGAEPPVFPRLVDRIDKVSDVMMADLLEWQTIFRARPLSLPA